MVTINANETGGDFSKLWDAAAREPVTVESAGKSIAVVMSPEEYAELSGRLRHRQAGCGRHLLSGAGIDVNELLATPIDSEFSESILSPPVHGDTNTCKLANIRPTQ